MADTEALPDEYEVERVIKHKVDDRGNLLFLTRGQGYGEDDDTWEPIGNFIHRYACDFVKYCKEHNLHPDILTHLKSTPYGKE